VVFAALWPMSLAFCVQLFVGRHVDDGTTFTGLQIAGRTVVVGVLASIGTAILPLPATIGGSLSGSVTVGGAIYAAELLALTAVAIPVLFGQWRSLRRDPAAADYANPLVLRYAAVYLAVMTVLWISALPAYFGAVNGVTTEGGPVGSLGYSVICLLIAGLSIAAAVNVSTAVSTAKLTFVQSSIG
jgi:hypothetical protein